MEEVHTDLLRRGLAPPFSLMNLQAVKSRVQNKDFKNLVDASVQYRFPQFYDQALRVFQKVVDIIRSDPSHKPVITLLNFYGKSTEWMNALFIDFLDRTGMRKQFEKIDVINFNYEDDEDDWIYEGFNRDPQQRRRYFVLLDDATYSGSQLRGVIGKVLKEFWEGHGKIGLIIAVAFATKTAVELLRGFLSLKKIKRPDHPIHLVTGAPLSDLGNTRLVQTLAQKLSLVEKRPRVPAIFNHKIPDVVSGYPGVYEKLYGEFNPFYKQTDKMIDRVLNTKQAPREDGKFRNYAEKLPQATSEEISKL